MSVFNNFRINKRTGDELLIYELSENNNLVTDVNMYNNIINETNNNIINETNNNINYNNIIDSFYSNMKVYKNGELITDDYYNNNNNNNNSYKYNTNQIIENVEQVDPTTFFGNSMKGVLLK